MLLLKQTSTDPDRVLIIGGGGATTGTQIAVVDVPASSSSMWLTGTFPDGVARSYAVSAVALPDGSVFICGGIPASGTPLNGGAAMLYRPPSGPGLGTLSMMDTLQYARQHHSIALLLPSAKVMVSGGDGAGNTIEVFSPPYLFDSFGAPLPESARPDITSFPDPAAGTIVLHGSGLRGRHVEPREHRPGGHGEADGGDPPDRCGTAGDQARAYRDRPEHNQRHRAGWKSVSVRRGRRAYTRDRGTWLLHAISDQHCRCTIPSEVHPLGLI